MIPEQEIKQLLKLPCRCTGPSDPMECYSEDIPGSEAIGVPCPCYCHDGVDYSWRTDWVAWADAQLTAAGR